MAVLSRSCFVAGNEPLGTRYERATLSALRAAQTRHSLARSLDELNLYSPTLALFLCNQPERRLKRAHTHPSHRFSSLTPPTPFVHACVWRSFTHTHAHFARRYLTVVPSAVIPKVIVYQPLSMVVNALFYSGDIGVQVDAIRTLTERPTAREVIGRNGFKVDGKLLPCEVLLKVVNGEHVRGPFGSEVRGRAARGVAIWMGNKSPGNHDAVGGNVWFGVDGLIKWFRKGYGKGVGVVRASGRLKGGKRGRGGEK